MSAIIVLVIASVVVIPVIAIGWTLRGEAARYLPLRECERRPRAE
jgi:hypothetical protein